MVELIKNMNYNNSQFFSIKEETVKWLREYGVSNYTFNDDLSVDVDGGVDISSKNLKAIPVNFRSVIGNFYCNNNKLTSLSGSPKTIQYGIIKMIQ